MFNGCSLNRNEIKGYGFAVVGMGASKWLSGNGQMGILQVYRPKLLPRIFQFRLYERVLQLDC